MKDLAPIRVPEAVGRSAVAQAVAKDRLQKAVTDAQLFVLMREDGDEAASEIQAIGFVLAVASALRHDKRIDGALSALAQMSYSGQWQRVNGVSVSNALDYALGIVQASKATAINDAVRAVEALKL
jgi:hypothetical protein